jgi:hypothetical protein
VRPVSRRLLSRAIQAIIPQANPTRKDTLESSHQRKASHQRRRELESSPQNQEKIQEISLQQDTTQITFMRKMRMQKF